TLLRHGLVPSDRVALRFSAQAPSMRAACALAADLRIVEPRSVRVRPTSLLPFERDWIVTTTTPAVTADLGIVFDWESTVQAIVHRHTGSFVLGWEPDAVEEPPLELDVPERAALFSALAVT